MKRLMALLLAAVLGLASLAGSGVVARADDAEEYTLVFYYTSAGSLISGKVIDSSGKEIRIGTILPQGSKISYKIPKFKGPGSDRFERITWYVNGENKGEYTENTSPSESDLSNDNYSVGQFCDALSTDLKYSDVKWYMEAKTQNVYVNFYFTTPSTTTPPSTSIISSGRQ